MIRICLFIFICILITSRVFSQHSNPFKPDANSPAVIAGYKLKWNDEFNKDGKPDSTFWKYENGFVRNKELQWYSADNANCKKGVLLIEGKREKVKNERYVAGSSEWRLNREYADYTSASIQTKGLLQWQFGRLEVRARIDTSNGSWPAIWTLGVDGDWPSNGEVDVMEFYRVKAVPTILANVAWGTSQPSVARWHTERIPLSNFTKKDKKWCDKFHIWRMDWNKDSINLYLDNELLNTTLLDTAVNPNGISPFLQPHFLLLNLALGENGGNPSQSHTPIKYEVDYVRVYEKDEN